MSDEELIRQEIGRFTEAYKNSDLERIISCYTHDLVKLRQGAPAEGREQLRARLANMFSDWRGSVRATVDEILVSDNIAFVRSHAEIALTPRDRGESQLLRLRFFELWRNENGRWRVARVMDNRES